MILNVHSLDEYIKKYQVDGIIWVANLRLAKEKDPVTFNSNLRKLAVTLSYVTEPDRRQNYLAQIQATYYPINRRVLKLKYMVNQILIKKEKR